MVINIDIQDKDIPYIIIVIVALTDTRCTFPEALICAAT